MHSLSVLSNTQMFSLLSYKDRKKQHFGQAGSRSFKKKKRDFKLIKLFAHDFLMFQLYFGVSTLEIQQVCIWKNGSFEHHLQERSKIDEYEHFPTSWCQGLDKFTQLKCLCSGLGKFAVTSSHLSIVRHEAISGRKKEHLITHCDTELVILKVEFLSGLIPAPATYAKYAGLVCIIYLLWLSQQFKAS